MAIDEYSDAVTREVESRLDDLFGEFEPVQEKDEPFETEVISAEPEPPVEEERPVEPSSPDIKDPIEQLKATFYSLDWEITEESMHTFFGQIMDLKKVYQNEPLIYQNLRLLGAVGKYIRRNKANAHPDSFGLFKSLFDCFENAISKKSEKAETKRIFKNEVLKFKNLRKEILKLSGLEEPPVSKRPKAEIEQAEASAAVAESAESFEMAVEEEVEDNGGTPIESLEAQKASTTIDNVSKVPDLEATVEDMKEFIKSELLKLKQEIVQQVLAHRSDR